MYIQIKSAGRSYLLRKMTMDIHEIPSFSPGQIVHHLFQKKIKKLFRNEKRRERIVEEESQSGDR